MRGNLQIIIGLPRKIKDFARNDGIKELFKYEKK
jgi:hypothetical protein